MKLPVVVESIIAKPNSLFVESDSGIEKKSSAGQMKGARSSGQMPWVRRCCMRTAHHLVVNTTND